MPSPSDLVVTGQMDDMMQYYDSVAQATISRACPRIRQGKTEFRTEQKRRKPGQAGIASHPAQYLFSRHHFSALPAQRMATRDAKASQPICKVSEICWRALLAEQQRLTNSVDELSQKLKDEQKRVETLAKSDRCHKKHGKESYS